MSFFSGASASKGPNYRALITHLRYNLDSCARELKKGDEKTFRLAAQHLSVIAKQATQSISSPESVQVLNGESWQWLVNYLSSAREKEPEDLEASAGPAEEESQAEGASGGEGTDAAAHSGKKLPRSFPGAENILCEVIDFAAFLAHKAEIQEKGLQHFLKEPWAQREFKHLIESKDRWAFDELKQMLSRGEPLAFDFLVELTPSCYALVPLFNTVVKDPNYQKLINEIFLNPPTENTLKQLKSLSLSLVLADEPLRNLQICELLFAHVKAFGTQEIKDLFLDILRKNVQSELIFEHLAHCIKSQEPWAIELLEQLILFFETPKKALQNSFVASLIGISLTDLSFAVALLCQISLSRNLNEFRALIEILPVRKRSIEVQILKSLLKGLQSIERQLQQAEEVSFSGEPLPWSEMPLDYRSKTLQALLTRKKDLILFFLGNLRPSESQDRALCEHFPRPRGSLVGLDERTDPIVRRLFEIPARGNFPIITMQPADNPHLGAIRASLPELRIVEGILKPQIWVRDYFIYGERRISVPAFFILSPEIVAQAKLDQAQRTGLPPAFRIMGSVASFKEQLKALEYLFQLKEQGLLGGKEIRFSFLYNEGGNFIRGPNFCIAGKDVLGINRRVIQRELDEMGIYVADGGEVKFIDREPFADLHVTVGDPAEEAEFAIASAQLDRELSHVTERHMEALLRLDAGVEEAFFVEQSHYHLDVTGHCVNPAERVIVLNDSELACRLMTDMACEKVRRGEYRDESDEILKVEDIISRGQPYLEEARLRRQYEDLTARDLERRGFRVIRRPGCFHQLERSHPHQHQVNFFNFVSFTNGEGQPCLLALGCEEDFQALFREFVAETMEVRPEHIFFMDTEASKQLIREGGGIHCILQMLL